MKTLVYVAAPGSCLVGTGHTPPLPETICQNRVKSTDKDETSSKSGTMTM